MLFGLSKSFIDPMEKICCHTPKNLFFHSPFPEAHSHYFENVFIPRKKPRLCIHLKYNKFMSSLHVLNTLCFITFLLDFFNKKDMKTPKKIN
jgi:hypothetical protein